MGREERVGKMEERKKREVKEEALNSFRYVEGRRKRKDRKGETVTKRRGRERERELRFLFYFILFLYFLNYLM